MSMHQNRTQIIGHKTTFTVKARIWVLCGSCLSQTYFTCAEKRRRLTTSCQFTLKLLRKSTVQIAPADKVCFFSLRYRWHGLHEQHPQLNPQSFCFHLLSLAIQSFQFCIPWPSSPAPHHHRHRMPVPRVRGICDCPGDVPVVGEIWDV